MPFMICLTLATGVMATSAGAAFGACLASRAPAITNARPLRKSATLTTNNQCTVRTSGSDLRESSFQNELEQVGL